MREGARVLAHKGWGEARSSSASPAPGKEIALRGRSSWSPAGSGAAPPSAARKGAPMQPEDRRLVHGRQDRDRPMITHTMRLDARSTAVTSRPDARPSVVPEHGRAEDRRLVHERPHRDRPDDHARALAGSDPPASISCTRRVHPLRRRELTALASRPSRSRAAAACRACIATTAVRRATAMTFAVFVPDRPGRQAAGALVPVRPDLHDDNASPRAVPAPVRRARGRHRGAGHQPARRGGGRRARRLRLRPGRRLLRQCDRGALGAALQHVRATSRRNCRRSSPSHFPVDLDRQGITGHSMGGHGALTVALRDPGPLPQRCPPSRRS